MNFLKTLSIVSFCVAALFDFNAIADPPQMIHPSIWTMTVSTAKGENSYFISQNGGYIPNVGFGLNCETSGIKLRDNNRYEYVTISCSHSAGSVGFSTQCERFSKNSAVAAMIIRHTFGDVAFTLNCNSI